MSLKPKKKEKEDGIKMSESNPQEINRDKELARVSQFVVEAYSKAATDFVKHLGETLLNWKGVEVNVIIMPSLNSLWTLKGGPTVQVWLSIGPADKDFKKVLFDIAKAASKAYNPIEVVNSHKVLKSKRDKVINKKGEPEFVIPLRYCQLSVYRSVTLKGPDGVSVTVEDSSGRRIESDMIMEAQSKLSSLIEWDNKEEEE